MDHSPNSPPAVTEPPMPPKPRRRRWWRWLVLAVVLLAAAVVALPYAIALPPVRSWIVSGLGSGLRGPCAIERLSWSWSKGVTVEGLEIGNPPGFPGERPALRMRRLTGGFAFGSLVSGPYSITGTIDGLEVFVEQRADGTTNLQELAVRDESRQGAEPTPREPPRPAPPSPPTGTTTEHPLAFDLQLRDALVEVRRDGQLLEALRDLQVRAHGTRPNEVHLDATAKLSAGSLEAHALHDIATGTTHVDVDGRGLDLAAWQPVIATFLPDQVTALAGKGDARLSVEARGADRVQLEGLVQITGWRLAGPIARGMDLRSDKVDVVPNMVVGTGAETTLDLGGFAVRCDWLLLTGAPPARPGTMRFDYTVDVAALARFGGPMPTFLRDGKAVAQGTLDVPTRELPKDAAGWTKAIALSADLSSDQREIAGFTLDALAAKAELRDGICKLTAAPPSQLDGGPVRADVQIDLTDLTRMPLTATFGWQGGRLTGGAARALRYAVPLFAGLDAAAAGVSGDCDLQMTLSGPAWKAEGQSWLAWLDQWSGNGSLGLQNAAFAPAQPLQGLLAPLGQLGQAVAPLGLSIQGLAQLGDQGKLAIDSFTAPFAFAQGVVRTTAGEWLAKGQRIGLSGAVGFDGALDYALDLTALLQGHKDGERVLQALSGALPPAKLVGTLDAPRLGLPELGDVAKKLLEGELKQKAEDLLKKQAEDLLKKGLDDLFKKKK